MSSVLTVLHNAVMAACDKLDGVADGLIDGPVACMFDPTTIACTAAKTTNCLKAG
jgi:feruloyl esterase